MMFKVVPVSSSSNSIPDSPGSTASKIMNGSRNDENSPSA
jgi:hypothetical protein